MSKEDVKDYLDNMCDDFMRISGTILYIFFENRFNSVINNDFVKVYELKECYIIEIDYY